MGESNRNPGSDSNRGAMVWRDKNLEDRFREIVGVNLLCYLRAMDLRADQAFVPPTVEDFNDYYCSIPLFCRTVDNATAYLLREVELQNREASTMQREDVRKANEIEERLRDLEKKINHLDELRKQNGAYLRIMDPKPGSSRFFEVSKEDTPDWFLLWLREHYTEKCRALEKELQKL